MDKADITRPRMTSSGALLILAVASAGTIVASVFLFFEPYMAGQRTFVLREQAARAEKAGQWALRAEENRLLALSEVACRWEGLAGERGAAAFDRRMAALRNVDAAWLRAADGNTVQAVSWWDDLAVTSLSARQAVDRGLAGPPAAPSTAPAARPGDPGTGPAGPEAASPTGLMAMAGEVVVFARGAVPSPPGEPSSARPKAHLYLARRLSGNLLVEMGSAVSADLTFVRADGLPANVLAEDAAGRSVWPLESDRLAVAWPAKDPAGRTLGYFRADVTTAQAQRQVSAVRRTILATLALSGGAIVLVILGASVLLANPMARLMERVRRVEAGGGMPEDFSRHLHAEPLVLAKRFEAALLTVAQLSKTDELTDLANRRQFDQTLQQAHSQARRYDQPLAVIAIDIDLFKAVNDTGGHRAGDEVIKAVARIIQRCCRKADLPARFGGDEFAVLLPHTPASNAAVVAERILRATAERPIPVNKSSYRVTVSIGVADLNSGRVENPDDLLALADRALYAAKQMGRNRIVQAHELDEPMWRAGGQAADRVEALRAKLAGLDTQFKALCVRALQEIVQALERRDPHMADHGRKVQHYAAMIARELNLSEEIGRRIDLAAMLHDIGMLALPDSIALCPGPFNEQQLEMMQRHPLIGARIIEGMEFLEPVIPSIRSHHERFDGKGYPQGLSGPGIPLAARIVAVADAFDAMTSQRAFRPAKALEAALRELRAGSATQFDPAAVEAFLAAADQLGEKLMDLPHVQAGTPEEEAAACQPAPA